MPNPEFAYPHSGNGLIHHGMTMHDYYVGQALIALVTSTSAPAAQHAKDAHDLADAVMKERAAREKKS